MSGLVQEWADRVQFLQLNIHDPANRELVNRLGAQYTPTFVLFDGTGREVWRSIGRLDPAEARRQVRSLG